MVAADFFTRHLSISWREGAARLAQQFGDGVVANNTGNWQWVAGTGSDRRPSRPLSPEQARRFDPDGAYGRRHVRELGTAVHRLPLA